MTKKTETLGRKQAHSQISKYFGKKGLDKIVKTFGLAFDWELDDTKLYRNMIDKHFDDIVKKQITLDELNYKLYDEVKSGLEDQLNQLNKNYHTYGK
jgi:hypothetical protein